MSSGLGESQVIAAAGVNTALEILRHRGPGKPHLLVARNDGPSQVIFQFLRNRNGVQSVAIPDEQVKIIDEDTGYDGDGGTKTFTGNTINNADDAIVPGTVEVEATATSPSMEDVDSDGTLWQTTGARKQGAGGTFAAMAGESMTVSVDGGAPQTVTFTTEATIALAAAAISAQLTGATGLEQGAQNVDITSDLQGKGSSIEVLTVDAGITTKLGISAGLSTNLGGTIDYFTGALEMVYQGYDPDTGDILVNYTRTPEIDAGEDAVLRLPSVQADDEIIVSAYAYNGPATLRAEIRPQSSYQGHGVG